jgi:hypothetical protein
VAGKRVLIAGTIAVVVPLLVCGGLAIGGELLARNAANTNHPCQPPVDEPALVAAYRAEPLLTEGAVASSAGLQVYRFCDEVGVDRIQPIGYTEVTYQYPAAGLRSAAVLRTLYGSTAEAEGWRYSGGRNDTIVAAVEFCRTVAGVQSTLTIAFVGHGDPPQHVTEVRQVVSVPADQSCPFHSDVWGDAGPRR